MLYFISQDLPLCLGFVLLPYFKDVLLIVFSESIDRVVKKIEKRSNFFLLINYYHIFNYY